MCFTLASRGQEFHLHENQVIKDLFGLRPSSPASCRLEGTDRSNSFRNSRFCLPANRSISERASIRLQHCVKDSSLRIRSRALCSFSAGAALGRTAVQGNPVVIGEAMMSSPFRSLRVCPPQMGIERSLKGTRARGEGKPLPRYAHVKDRPTWSTGYW